MKDNKYRCPIIFYHSNAGGKRSNKNFHIFLEKIKNEKLFETIEIFNSKTPLETIEKISEVHDQGIHDLIVCFGGDGTISSVCNGLMKIDKKTRLPLLPIPGGSGNSFLKDFNVLKADDAIKRFKSNQSSVLDVIYVKEKEGDFSYYCINLLGMGFISDIANYAVNEGKKMGGFSYVLGTIFSLKEFKPYKTKLIFNDGKDTFESDKVFFLTISNTMYSGGSLLLAPDAKYDDGIMDIIILHDINRLQFLNGFRKTFTGKHVEQKGCRYIKTKNLEIYANPEFTLMPDGELEGQSPICVEVIPKQITLVI